MKPFVFVERLAHPRVVCSAAVFALGVSGCGSMSGDNTGSTSSAASSSDTGSYTSSDGGVATTFEVKQTDLVSDEANVAPTRDKQLLNPWGLVANPDTGLFWVAANHAGLLTVYPPSGGASEIDVKVPPPEGDDANEKGEPTGQVFNDSEDDFKGDKFIVDTEDGTLAGWQDGTSAVKRVDRSSDSGYKGLALVHDGKTAKLVAANFHKGTVDVFDADYKLVKDPGFEDADIPSGYAPFNVAALGDQVYITYAKQDKDKGDDVRGRGHGYVSVFDTDGSFVDRLISKGELNSPWGLAIAPKSWGDLANSLLVGNFGDGAIHAYDPDTGELLSTLTDKDGNTLKLDGLWAIVVGPKEPKDYSKRVYFTAAPDDEAHGLYGYLAVP